MVYGNEITVTVGAVATESPEAAKIGAQMFERGGNAMDAAAAACLASGVVFPHFADIGGYVCSGTILQGSAGQVWSLDSNSVAPAAAHDSMFKVMEKIPGKIGINENEYECSVRGEANIYGPLAVGPPGFMGGVGMLWERWGRLKWPEIVEPSLGLLENGFPYGDVALAIEKRLHVISQFEPTRQHLLPNDKLPKPDAIWRRPDLDKTLARLASAGWRDFYDGEIGRRVADYVTSIGGILTRSDMAGFEPRITNPLQTSYRDATVYGPILPSGSLSAMQILNMLDCFEPLRLEDSRSWHRLAEILKLAWRDRLLYLADPDFADIPSSRLLSRDYAAGRVETVRNFPDHVDRTGLPQAPANPHGTAHVSAADAEGNMVAVTISQGNPFGACVTVPGTGFILAHGMCRFDPRPGLPNSIKPHKRPLNNISPLILRMPGRDVALGMRGGRRIISVIPQIAHRLVDFGMTSHQAATGPRIHTLAQEPVECEESPVLAFEKELISMGHELRRVDELGGTAHCAELLLESKKIRAGGGVGAAGV